MTLAEPCYGISATAIERVSEEQPKYIRITDFDDSGIKENHKFMTAESYTKKHLLEPADILFARTGGTVGKTYYYDGSIGKAVFAGYCIRFRFDKNKVLPKYVYWCTKTDFYNLWVKGTQRPSGQPNINKEEFKSFQIPLLSLEKQKSLVDFMDAALEQQRAKLEQAEKLINSITNKIADIIGIKISDISIELFNAVKLISINNSITKRLDPKCYSKKFAILRNEITSSVYKKYALKDLILENTSGDWGEAADSVDNEYVKCLVLRATEISNRHNIEIKEDKAQYRAISKKKLTAMNMEIGDMIVEKSGGSEDQPVGRVVYLDRLEYNGVPIAYSNFLTKLKVNSELVDPYYLFEYLRFIYNIGLTEVMQNQTNGIRNLIFSEFLAQTIIVPENHKEIGLAIKAIRQQARALELEAEQEWQQAKEQFEKELLAK